MKIIRGKTRTEVIFEGKISVLGRTPEKSLESLVRLARHYSHTMFIIPDEII